MTPRKKQKKSTPTPQGNSDNNADKFRKAEDEYILHRLRQDGYQPETLSADTREILLKNYRDMLRMQDEHVKKLLYVMRDTGVGKALNKQSIEWLLYEHINENLGKYPILEKLSFKNRVLVDLLTVEQLTGLIQFFNLLETGNLFDPIPMQDFEAVIYGKYDRFRNGKRKKGYLKAGVCDENGNIQHSALKRAETAYALIRNYYDGKAGEEE